MVRRARLRSQIPAGTLTNPLTRQQFPIRMEQILWLLPVFTWRKGAESVREGTPEVIARLKAFHELLVASAQRRQY